MRTFLFFLTSISCYLFTNNSSLTIRPDSKSIKNSDAKPTLFKKSSLEVSTKELIIDLKNPTFSNGILFTNEGGVIKNADLRIQAKKIRYTNKQGQHKVEAEGSLMMIYKNNVFVGERLEYDFIDKKGIIYNAATYFCPWYLRGEIFFLDKEGNYSINNVSITDCENKKSTWDMFAKKVCVDHQGLINAEAVRFRLFSFPVLWFPSFKLNLKKFLSKPIFSFKPNWDKASGPRASIRYEAYSWQDFALYLRLDYRFKMGLGGAVETEYLPEHKRTRFITRSYLAQDMIPNDLSKKRRYRFDGLYQHRSEDNKTTAYISWDKYSDIRMPGDFKCEDFELGPAKKTELMLHNKQTNLITLLYARAKANPFETIKEDLPTIYLNVRPIKSEKTGLISYNFAKISYLDYTYSNDVCFLKDFHSFRGEFHDEIYRPIYLLGTTLTPKAGFSGIIYSRSPDKEAKALTAFSYGGKLQSDLYHLFNNKRKHIVEPYIEYFGLVQPNIDPNDHYIFSIADGYHSLNLLKFGILNQLFSLEKLNGKPTFEVNTYANCFLGNSKTKLFTPKGYLTFSWNFPSLFLYNENCWNFDKKRVDFSNARVGWTISENVAISLEIRYRSPYDWRKADKENFILDFAGEESQMLHSPLSDRRSAFLSHLFFRITPYWTLHFESHRGWNRKKEKGYNEFKIDLYSLVSTRWKISLSYLHTEVDDRFTFDYFLTKF